MRCGAAANTRHQPGSGLAAASDGGMIDPVLFGRWFCSNANARRALMKIKGGGQFTANDRGFRLKIRQQREISCTLSYKLRIESKVYRIVIFPGTGDRTENCHGRQH
jgi:hypothetical protein